MVIDLGSGSLFKPTGLEQDTGLLKERWDQTGSVVKNITKSTVTAGTAYTVTAGKRLYVSFVAVSDTGTGAGSIRDTSGGADKLQWKFGSAGTLQFSPPVPLFFDTEVYYDESSASGGTISITGWEEASP